MKQSAKIIPIIIAIFFLFLAPCLLEAKPEHTPGKVNINSATLDIITTLPGIGKVTAEKIIKYRDEHGKFKKKEDLITIKGIGQKKFEKIKNLFILSDEAKDEAQKQE